jgi:hypothetical protein
MALRLTALPLMAMTGSAGTLRQIFGQPVSRLPVGGFGGHRAFLSFPNNARVGLRTHDCLQAVDLQGPFAEGSPVARPQAIAIRVFFGRFAAHSTFWMRSACKGFGRHRIWSQNPHADHARCPKCRIHLFFPGTPDDLIPVMALWLEDFSACTLEDVFRLQAENRAWNKELRRKTNSLVNSRLANDISQADYQTNRKVAHEDAAECRRRANILDAQIVRRTAG